ncbi:hypothetical protein NX059_004332 [Plenodomus lindquistii]|nr:hypothetical protein NX059_004332 [Plenodomus lindquistii]
MQILELDPRTTLDSLFLLRQMTNTIIEAWKPGTGGCQRGCFIDKTVNVDDWAMPSIWFMESSQSLHLKSGLIHNLGTLPFVVLVADRSRRHTTHRPHAETHKNMAVKIGSSSSRGKGSQLPGL